MEVGVGRGSLRLGKLGVEVLDGLVARSELSSDFENGVTRNLRVALLWIERICELSSQALKVVRTHQLGNETLAILHLVGELRMRLPRPLELGLALLDLAEELLHLPLLALALAYEQLEFAHARSITLLVGYEQLDRLLLSLDETGVALRFGRR